MGILTIGGFWLGFLTVLFILISVLLSLIILVQKPKGGGLSGAFGGAGGGGQVFGGKSGDVLTWITVGFFVSFLFVGVLLVFAARGEIRALEQPVNIETSIDAEDPGAGGLGGAGGAGGLGSTIPLESNETPGGTGTAGEETTEPNGDSGGDTSEESSDDTEE